MQKTVLAILEKEMLKCDNKCRFIKGVVEGSIIVSNRKKADLFAELKAKGFTPLPKKENVAEVSVAGSTSDTEESGQSRQGAVSRGDPSDYDYLLSLAIGILTLEKMQELLAERERRAAEVADLQQTSVKTLWMRDIDALEAKLIEDVNTYEKKWEADRKRINSGTFVNGPKKRNPPKKNLKTSKKEPAGDLMEVSENTAVPETDKVVEIKKPRGKAAAKKKAPASKVTESVDEDDDDIADLRARMAAYNFDSSPDRPEDMESEVVQKPANKKAPSKKKTSSSVSEIDDDDDDVEWEERTKGGRKPANMNAAKPPLAGTKKRAPAKKQSQTAGQKQITEMLKPAAENSPDKKVRKMRSSPFNKKSGSVLGRTISVDDEEEDEPSEASASTLGSGTDAAAPAVARPKRATRVQTRYVISDSESEGANDDDDGDASAASDFSDDFSDDE